MFKKRHSKMEKPEIIEGEIDFLEMIKADFWKALLIIGLIFLATVITTAGLLLAFLFLR
ncbi:MAG: hypothetical protein ACTSWT_00810 [Candidatus Heimdallarchaeota archaeon]